MLSFNISSLYLKDQSRTRNGITSIITIDGNGNDQLINDTNCNKIIEFGGYELH